MLAHRSSLQEIVLLFSLRSRESALAASWQGEAGRGLARSVRIVEEVAKRQKNSAARRSTSLFAHARIQYLPVHNLN